MNIEALELAIKLAKIDGATQAYFSTTSTRVLFYRPRKDDPREMEQTGYTNMDDEYVCVL